MTVADFFFYFFSTISNFSIFPKKAAGPGASEKPFGPSRGVREGILGAPGGSGAHLGAALGRLGAILERLFEQSDFGSIF